MGELTRVGVTPLLTADTGVGPRRCCCMNIVANVGVKPRGGGELQALMRVGEAQVALGSFT